MKTASENTCFGGTQGVYSHTSKSCACDMTFAVFLPVEAKDGPVSVLWYLSGLTCTHEKRNVQKRVLKFGAAEHGDRINFPGTPPRAGKSVSDDENYDPWARCWDFTSMRPKTHGKPEFPNVGLHHRRVASIDRRKFSASIWTVNQ